MPKGPQGQKRPAAGTSAALWTTEDIAEKIEARGPQPGKRGPYKKRAT